MNTRTVFAALGILALAGCSEPSQELHSAAQIGQTPEYDGTGSHFVAPGWTQGDKASWGRELTVRTQRGQNEYTRIN